MISYPTGVTPDLEDLLVQLRECRDSPYWNRSLSDIGGMVLLKGAEAEVNKYSSGPPRKFIRELGGLMPAYEKIKVLQGIKQEFQGLGYDGSLLQEDYAYADVLGPVSEYAVKQIDLAAFTQYPPSYRTASFGVAVSNGRSGPELIMGHRSLGAPQILEVSDDRVYRWKVTGKGMPVLLQAVDPNELPGLFAKHKETWSPQHVLRAKSAGTLATQLDSSTWICFRYSTMRFAPS